MMKPNESSLKNRYLLSVIFLILMGLVPAAAGADLQLNGYFKSFFIAFKMPGYLLPEGWQNDPFEFPVLGAVNNRIRLKLSADLSKRLSLHAAYDLSPRVQDPALFQQDLFFAAPDSSGYRVYDLPGRVDSPGSQYEGSLGVFQNLDRFFITIKTDFADIFIGRQAIAWGSAQFINPTDVLAPFAFNELDTEERRGVDALRIRIPIGTLDELDFGFVAGEDFDLKRSAAFARGKINLFNTDLSLLLVGFRQHLMMGFDMSRSIGGAGFWLEAAFVMPEFFKKEAERQKRQKYFRSSIGLNYNFTGKTYAFLEYHFNSPGSRNPEDYLKTFDMPAYQDGAVYLMSRHYLNGGITYQIHPLLPLTGLVIWNLNDGSLILAPSAEYNIAENIYIAAGAYIGLGKKPELLQPVTAPFETGFKSEFGAYPDMFFASFRIYF